MIGKLFFLRDDTGVAMILLHISVVGVQTRF